MKSRRPVDAPGVTLGKIRWSHWGRAPGDAPVPGLHCNLRGAVHMQSTVPVDAPGVYWGQVRGDAPIHGLHCNLRGAVHMQSTEPVDAPEATGDEPVVTHQFPDYISAAGINANAEYRRPVDAPGPTRDMCNHFMVQLAGRLRETSCSPVDRSGEGPRTSCGGGRADQRRRQPW